MTYPIAKALISIQENSIRQLHGKRFTHNEYEYEMRYESGFAPMIAIYRRAVGKRNFKYYSGVSVFDCSGAHEALRRVEEAVCK